MFSEDELIPISVLQYYSFCPRQVALIHLEQLWEGIDWGSRRMLFLQEASFAVLAGFARGFLRKKFRTGVPRSTEIVFSLEMRWRSMYG
jgi:hypothetical protein